MFNPFAIPIRRPVATSMFFLAISCLGLFSWYRIPIELIPELSGDELYVTITRPGSEPDVVEREILIPLESRIEELAGVDETWAEINGFSAQVTIAFEPGTNYRVRELELNRIAADIVRTQPQGTSINVSSNNTSLFSRLVLQVQILGGDDPVSLRDFADQQLQTKFVSVPGVSQALFQGAPPREVTVWIDPDRCAELGIRPGQVTNALARSVQHLRFVGGIEENNQRYSVMLDGRPEGVVSLGEIRIDPSRPVLLRHVAEIEMGAALQENIFRINGQSALGLILFQEEGANVVELGRALKARIAELKAEYNPYGIDFVIGFDASQTIEDQIDRLKKLALSGFVIALLVLFLFLKEIRAVAVVAIAVPVSLLVAGAMLYLGGWTLNLITLSGLAIGVGMLIDNSIVVYEAVQRCLERGLSPENAAIDGISRTIRAILTASLTTAIVYLPVYALVEDVTTRAIILLVAAAILLPLLASLLVAVGLVPLLSQQVAAKATLSRLARSRDQRELTQGIKAPQPARELFSGMLKSALRRPTPWIAIVSLSVLLTIIIALPWVLVSSLSQQAEQADEIRLEVSMEGNSSLDAASDFFIRLEQAAMDIEGVEQVTSNFQEASGDITIDLVDKALRPPLTTAGMVRRVLYKVAEDFSGIEISTGGDEQGGGDAEAGLTGSGPSQIILSGPNMAQLNSLASEIQENLSNIAVVESTSVTGRQGRDELRIIPDFSAMNSYQLFPEDVLQTLNVFRREGVQMQVGFVMADGRELPLTIRQPEFTTSSASRVIEDLMISYQQGALPMGEVTTVTTQLPPTNITHHNGRRELSVNYQLSETAAGSGPLRQQLDDQIQQAVNAAFIPEGYTVETFEENETSSLVTTLALPILFLLFAVMAIAFESLTLPILILLAVPLTILGATWALVFAGMGGDMMAGVGAIALLGLTVNPAIILVDRMQHRLLNSGCSGGTAAMGAVRERTRPVLMTTCTTIAGLWPLTLTTGEQNEIWPPFATVIIGGLTTSTLLTLLVIPVGFVFLSRIDRLFSRLGIWVTLSWFGACTLVLAPLFIGELITSFYWKIISALLVGSIFLWLAKKIFIRDAAVTINPSPITVETRYLSKIYGEPGPITRAFQIGKAYSQNLLMHSKRDYREQALIFVLLFAAGLYLTMNLSSAWRFMFAYLAGAMFSRFLINMLRSMRATAGAMPASDGSAAGPTEASANRLEKFCLFAWPWAVLAALVTFHIILPLSQGLPTMPYTAIALFAVFTVFLQISRATAMNIADKKLQVIVGSGFMSSFRTGYRRFCMEFFSLGLARESVVASSNISFKVEEGMVGILGPNGAGKTTLLRTLAGVMEPSIGTTHFAGLEKRSIPPVLFSELIGYLPQEFGLPDHLTAEEYLHYYAILYRVGNKQERHERVDSLLQEVGLADRKHDQIGGFSGGMRQRVAVARTLLRKPPVIIVDEPTVGLDPRERIRFRNLLAKLAKGRVILFSTHVVEDVAVSCERVLVFSTGTIAYDGAPAELADKAAGQVWLLLAPTNQQPRLLPSAKVIDQIPQGLSNTQLRILCEQQPHPDATPTDANMEDGYMQLQKGNFTLQSDATKPKGEEYE